MVAKMRPTPLLLVSISGAVLLLLMVTTTVSGSDAPVRRRDLRYRPNNGYSYQYTSVHSGIEGDSAKALAYQHRLEAFRDDVKRSPPVSSKANGNGIVPAAPPVAVAVVALNARSPHPTTTARKPQYPSRRNGIPAAADRRRTTVDASSASRSQQQHHQQQRKVASSYSHHVEVQQYH